MLDLLSCKLDLPFWVSKDHTAIAGVSLGLSENSHVAGLLALNTAYKGDRG